VIAVLPEALFVLVDDVFALGELIYVVLDVMA